MVGYRYSRKVDEHCSKAVGRALPISTKTSTEVCRFVRGRTLVRAKTLLTEVVAKRQAVPLVRYFQEVGHKPGMAVGKYPVNCARHILSILNSAEKNAQSLGLNVDTLFVYHIAAQRAATTHHYGRHGRRAKRTHIEVVLKEQPKGESQ